MRSLVDYYNAYLHDKDIKEYVDKYVKCHRLLEHIQLSNRYKS